MTIHSGATKSSSNHNLAARVGRWSAQHRKKAILGWLAFVVLAAVLGESVGTKTLDQSNFGIGESGRADKAASDHFPDRSQESVLVQVVRQAQPRTVGASG